MAVQTVFIGESVRVPLKKQEYIRVNLGLDKDPHDHIPMIWRINGGAFCGLAHNAKDRDSKYRFVSIFVDNIFTRHSWKIQTESAGMVYADFLMDLLRVIFHEYTHHIIEPEFVGYEKTKIDPAAYALVSAWINQDNFEEWASWWMLFKDCYDFLENIHLNGGAKAD